MLLGAVVATILILDNTAQVSKSGFQLKLQLLLVYGFFNLLPFSDCPRYILLDHFQPHNGLG